MAKSLECIDIIPYQVSKSTNLEDTKDRKKDSTTLAVKYMIQKGAYVAYGSIYPQLAELTGFSYEDALILKKSVINSLYVHKSLHITPKDEFPFYSCDPEEIPGIELSVL